MNREQKQAYSVIAEQIRDTEMVREALISLNTSIGGDTIAPILDELYKQSSELKKLFEALQDTWNV